MNVRSLLKKSAVGVVSAAAAIPTLVFAQGSAITDNLNNVGTAAQLSTQDLPVLVGRYINAFLGVLGVVFVVLIIYAGFLYLNSQGEADGTKKAVAMIKNAVIGLIIIFAAYAISNFVIQAVISASGA
jgi:cytochrome bd-type quinol oxidase subunit 2